MNQKMVPLNPQLKHSNLKRHFIEKLKIEWSLNCCFDLLPTSSISSNGSVL